MAQAGLDALICVLPKNVYYLSDFQSDWLFDVPWVACAILPLRRDIPATLIVHDVELTNLATAPSWMPELRVYLATVCGVASAHYSVNRNAALTDEESRTVALMQATSASSATSLIEALTHALKDLSLDSSILGFDDLRMQQQVAAHYDRSQCRDAMHIVQNIRMVKSSDEIGLMRRAARFNKESLDAAMNVIAPGVLWSEVNRTYNRAAVERDCRPFCLYVGSGRRSLGLRRNHDYPIQVGEQVCFDGMLTFERYFGDSQRTCVVGPPSEQLILYWSAVQSAADECYGRMRPGVDTNLLRDLALETVRAKGVPEFRHAFVHGLGLDHLELPSNGRSFEGFKLESGMVVNMDIEVCEIGFGGVFFEESMLITSNGAERLYDIPRELIRIRI